MKYGHSPRNLAKETLKDLQSTLPPHHVQFFAPTKQIVVCVVRLDDGRELAGVCSYWGRDVIPEKSRELAYKKALFSLRNALAKQQEAGLDVRRGTPNKT